MIWYTAVVSSLILLNTAIEGALSGRRDEVTIINPNYTDISQFNFMVAVLKGNELLGGGVIIKKQWVLTAAYNTDGFRASDIRVRVASNSPSSGGRIYRVTRIVQHPSYIGNWTYDLSLLKLGAPVNPSVAQPVSSIAANPFSGQADAVVTGYGVTTKSKKLKIKREGLQYATVHLYDYKTCDIDWYGDELSAGEICGYSPGVGPCWSDFGDPVVACADDGSCTLIGLFAGSYGCADSHYPGIYMDTGLYRSWIMTNSK